ncbi:N-glycosidase [Penicillium longicatenatum]|nr:N-glycosidase [Penicillium longicatenatum]
MALADNTPVYFWKPEGENGVFGQWYPSSFVWTQGTETFNYANAEQYASLPAPAPASDSQISHLFTKSHILSRYMMHRKALLFAPTHPITKRIYEGWKIHPRSLRSLGRQIPNFVDSVWEAERYAAVLEGSYLKFSQNEDLKLLLLETGDRELVEASPRDRIWGIGFGKDTAGMRREEWGLNLLGKALMEVRARLREEGLRK